SSREEMRQAPVRASVTSASGAPCVTSAACSAACSRKSRVRRRLSSIGDWSRSLIHPRLQIGDSAPPSKARRSFSFTPCFSSGIGDTHITGDHFNGFPAQLESALSETLKLFTDIQGGPLTPRLKAWGE